MSNKDIPDKDLDLFNEIYTEYKNIIYYWIRRKTSDRSSYDDIFQDVMMKIFRSLKNYDVTRGSIKNYIKVITFSCVTDYYRKFGKNKPIINDDVILSVSDDSYIRETEIIDLEHDLTPFEYDLFVERYVMHMSKREICKDMGLKYTTCRNRLKELDDKLNKLYNK